MGVNLFQEDSLFKLHSLAKNCPLDIEYHSEETLHKHMKLAAEHTNKIMRREGLSHDDTCLLYSAALMHDISKVTSTVCNEDGKVYTKEHADESARMAFMFAKQSDIMTGRQLYALYYLIKFHDAIYRKYDSVSDYERMVLKLGYILPLDLLYFLIESNALGRKSACSSTMMRELLNFRDTAMYLGTWYDRYKFQSDYTKYLYFNQGFEDRTANVIDNMKQTCYLICGTPGSRMEEWARINKEGLPIISPALIKADFKNDKSEIKHRVKEVGKKMAREYVDDKKDFVWCCYDLKEPARKKIIDYLHSIKVRTHMVYLDKPLKKLISDNPTKRETILKGLYTFDVPNPTECLIYERVEK